MWGYGFGCWVLGSEFWVLDLGSWVLGFGFWVWGLGFGVWGLPARVLLREFDQYAPERRLQVLVTCLHPGHHSIQTKLNPIHS